MRTNTLKQKLRDGKAVFGSMITFPAPPIVEMLGYMGFDWVLIDNEHGSITVDTAESMSDSLVLRMKGNCPQPAC